MLKRIEAMKGRNLSKTSCYLRQLVQTPNTNFSWADPWQEFLIGRPSYWQTLIGRPLTKVFYWQIPKEYIPGVTKGLEEMMSSGALAGFPVVDVVATLYDGSYHDVDSSVLAFQIAARAAFR